MGQCPSNPEFRFGDDPSTETDSQTVAASCYAVLPLHRIFAGAEEPTFLKRHKPDRDQKCILAPWQVSQSLKLQADAMLARDGLGRPLNTNEDLLPNMVPFPEDGDTSRSVPDFVSDIAPSEMTTFSTATRPVANLGRPVQSKRKQHSFSVMENISGVPNIATIDSCDGPDDEIAFFTRKHQKSLRREAAMYTDRRTGMMAPPSINMRKVSWERIEKGKQGVLGLTPWLEQRAELLERRERYMAVLQLKMKAHLGYYYTQRYLPLFPNAPAPAGLSRRNVRAPLLVPEDSSSSSSSANSQSIDFGSIPPSTQVMAEITNSPFMDLALTGSLGLVPRQGHHGAARQRSSSRRNMKSPDHYLVLINSRSGVPLAVCALKSIKGNPVVRMFATKPRVSGQRTSATTKQLGLDWAGNFPLYAWAEIVTDIHPDPVSFSIFMASGSEGRFSATPCYRASLDGSGGKPTLEVVGRTDKEVQQCGCALIDLELDEESRNDEDLVFKLRVAQGIDPALIICFAAIADEVMEKSMRLQARSGVPTRRNTRQVDESNPARGRGRHFLEL